MKILTMFFAGLLALALAEPEPVQVAAEDATLTPTMATTSTNGVRVSDPDWICWQPQNGAPNWYRLNKSEGPHTCREPHLSSLKREWTMLRSYRDGGIQNIHWKYTDNANDPECMNNWIYHAADGIKVKTMVPGRTTTYGLNRRWCALPVYLEGGVQGYQWDYCDCRLMNNDPPMDLAPAPTRG